MLSARNIEIEDIIQAAEVDSDVLQLQFPIKWAPLMSRVRMMRWQCTWVPEIEKEE